MTLSNTCHDINKHMPWHYQTHAMTMTNKTSFNMTAFASELKSPTISKYFFQIVGSDLFYIIYTAMQYFRPMRFFFFFFNFTAWKNSVFVDAESIIGENVQRVVSILSCPLLTIYFTLFPSRHFTYPFFIVSTNSCFHHVSLKNE